MIEGNEAAAVMARVLLSRAASRHGSVDSVSTPPTGVLSLDIREFRDP